MENMAPLRSSTSHGGSGDFLVCLSSDDSPHLVKHKQIQLVGRCQRRSDCAKRRDAEVIHFAVVGRDVLHQYNPVLYRIFEVGAQREFRREARLWPC